MPEETQVMHAVYVRSGSDMVIHSVHVDKDDAFIKAMERYEAHDEVSVAVVYVSRP